MPVFRCTRSSAASLTDLSSLWRYDRTFEPEWTTDRREDPYRAWTRAVHRSRDWLEP